MSTFESSIATTRERRGCPMEKAADAGITHHVLRRRPVTWREARPPVRTGTGGTGPRQERRGLRLLLLPALALAAPAAAPAGAAAGAPGLPEPRPLRSPAGAGSRTPDLAALPDGRVLLSWFEPARTGGTGAGMALRCATLDGARWGPVSTIAEGDSFFVNWADFPSVRALEGGRLAAHWLWRSGEGAYAYDVRLSQSGDGGRTWSAPVTPHEDATRSEHGFVSLVAGRGGVHAVWLDGRHTVGHEEGASGPGPEMTLRTAKVTPEGRLLEAAELDARTCDCCQTAAVMTDRGLLVAYRDRSAGEIRDIGVVRGEGGRWTAPRLVHADEWHIPGCPVNGPALAARGSHAAIVWYTAARDTPRVLAAFSDDAGDSFGPPVHLDDGDPLGRVHAAMLDDGSVVATWLESGGRDALIRARRIARGGEPGPAVTIARTSSKRASGFPRVVQSGGALYFAWTEAGERPRVRLAVMPGKSIPIPRAGAMR